MSMKRKVILFGGLALIAALILNDRLNAINRQIPGVVLNITSQDHSENAEIWIITAQTAEGETRLTPLTNRPALAPGDSICINHIRRTARSDSFHLTTPDGPCE